MSQADFAASMMRAYCTVTWPDNARAMEPTATEHMAHKFEGYRTYHSHKYVPDIETINKAINARDGAGVYGCALFDDGSSILLTCEHGIVVMDERGLVVE